MSSPTTFHRFKELPTEMQLEIFQLAASPDGPLPLDSVIMYISRLGSVRTPSGRAVIRHRSGHLLAFLADQCTRNFQGEGWRNGTGLMRRNLKYTSRLSRLVVLETWKRELASAELPGKVPWEFQSIMLKMLNRIIGYASFWCWTMTSD